MEIKEFENYIYELISENDYKVGIKLFYEKINNEYENINIFFMVIKKIKTIMENKKEQNYATSMLLVLECISREKNLIDKYESYQEYEKKKYEIENAIEKNLQNITDYLNKRKDYLNYNELNIIGVHFKKRLLLEQAELSPLEKVKLNEGIKVCANKCKEIKINERNRLNKRSDIKKRKNNILKVNEEPLVEIEKNSLLLIDYDNIKPSSTTLQNLTKEITVILICHRLSQKKIIDNFNIKGNFKVINVNSEFKQSSDFKIYSLLTRAQLMNVRNLYLLSKDKGFDVYCEINKINYIRIENIENAHIKDSIMNNLMNIDEITFDNKY